MEYKWIFTGEVQKKSEGVVKVKKSTEGFVITFIMPEVFLHQDWKSFCNPCRVHNFINWELVKYCLLLPRFKGCNSAFLTVLLGKLIFVPFVTNINLFEGQNNHSITQTLWLLINFGIVIELYIIEKCQNCAY